MKFDFWIENPPDYPPSVDFVAKVAQSKFEDLDFIIYSDW